MMRKGLLTVLAGAALLVTSCGYNLVGRGGQFPAGVDKVSVPIFANETRDTEIARRLTNSFVAEMVTSGRVQVVSEGEAEARILGTVTRYEIEPITFNVTRKATENRIIVAVDVSLVLKGEEEPVFEQKDVTRYHEYPISEDLALQQREEDLAYREVSRELSQRIIALMTGGF
jgi:outer membrane lipopolysaccharide assembly protein LptE/RlpB